MSRSDIKQKNNSVATTGKQSRRPAKRSNGAVAYQGPIYTLEQVREGVRALSALPPETHQFTTTVQNYGVSDKVGNGKVAVVPSVDMTFFKESPGHWVQWRFDGALAFPPGQLQDGERPAGVEFLASEASRGRLGEIILEASDPWFGERIDGFRVKSGFMRGDDLVALVSLAVVDEQELQFIDLALAFQQAVGHVLNEMEPLVMKPRSKTLSPSTVRTAIARARIALERVRATASTEWQKTEWRRREEDVSRIEAWCGMRDVRCAQSGMN